METAKNQNQNGLEEEFYNSKEYRLVKRGQTKKG